MNRKRDELDDAEDYVRDLEESLKRARKERNRLRKKLDPKGTRTPAAPARDFGVLLVK